jgi:hypothetical protein
MISTNENVYLSETIKLFKYYKALAEKAMEQLDKEQLFYSHDSDKVNSIAVIINHLCGNMVSRWSDFLTTDGEKTWRDRDAEFQQPEQNFDAIMEKWHEGWACLLKTLESLKADQLGEIVYIRNEGHTVIEAIQRQLAHYSMHVGQIIFYAKQLKQGSWTSLSIPLGKSGEYNSDKFGQEKQIRNFTDEELKRLQK